MPRKNHWSSGGAVGVEITPHMREILMLLRCLKSSTEVAERMRLTREAISAMVRYVETKTKRKLFVRATGRGNDRWTDIDDPMWSWLIAHRLGGTDWPVLA